MRPYGLACGYQYRQSWRTAAGREHHHRMSSLRHRHIVSTPPGVQEPVEPECPNVIIAHRQVCGDGLHARAIPLPTAGGNGISSLRSSAACLPSGSIFQSACRGWSDIIAANNTPIVGANDYSPLQAVAINRSQSAPIRAIHGLFRPAENPPKFLRNNS